MELKTKKRIVGFILLIALGLMLVPLLFGRSVVPPDELKLSDHVPNPPVKSAELDLPVPSAEATVANVKPVPVPQSTPSSRIVFEQAPLPDVPGAREEARPINELDSEPLLPSVEESESAALRLPPQPAKPKVDTLDAPKKEVKEVAAVISVPAPLLPSEKIVPEPDIVKTKAQAPALKSPALAQKTPVSSESKSPTVSALKPVVPPPKAKATVVTPNQTTTPAPEIAPPKASTSSVLPVSATPEAWVVQMGSFSDKTNADMLVKKIQAAGFPSYLTHSTTSQGPLFRVFVGPEILKSTADDVKGRLAQSLNLTGIVVKKP